MVPALSALPGLNLNDDAPDQPWTEGPPQWMPEVTQQLLEAHTAVQQMVNDLPADMPQDTDQPMNPADNPDAYYDEASGEHIDYGFT